MPDDASPPLQVLDGTLASDPATLSRADPAPPSMLVIFGGGGDLTKRLLMPAIYNLSAAGLLGDDVSIVGTAPVTLYPYALISRHGAPKVSGYYILHEGLLGVVDGRLKEIKYTEAKSEGAKNNGVALTATSADEQAVCTVRLGPRRLNW